MEVDKKSTKEEIGGKEEDYLMKSWKHSSCMHSHMAGKMIAGLVGIVIIAGVVCAVVRLSDHREARGRGVQSVSIQPESFEGRGMMRGGRGGMQVRESVITGKISKIDGNNLTITGNNKDLTVVVQDTTSLYDNANNIISKTDLKVDNQIIISGQPNSSGQVLAQMIRGQ